MLQMADGARVEVRPESQLSLERSDDGGTSIQLNKGDVIVDASSQVDGKLFVMTKDMIASVGGAVSLVRAEEDGSRVAAIGGEVHIEQGSVLKTLRLGEQATSNPRMEWVSLKEELAWSRQPIPQLALFQEGPTTAPVAQQGVLRFEEASIRPAAPVAPPAGEGARGGGLSGGRAPCSVVGVQLDPTRFRIPSASLHELLALAYGRCQDLAGTQAFPRLSGGPEWARSDRWDLEAVIPAGAADRLPTGFMGAAGELLEGRSPKVQQMLRAVLQERFKVSLRRETKEMPVHVLTVAPGGTKFQGNALPNFPAGASFGFIGADGTLTTPAQGAESYRINLAARCRGESSGRNCSSVQFWNQYLSAAAGVLSGFFDRPVLDRTGISEKVSFNLEWPRDPGPANRLPPPPTFQTLAKALEDVGLELKEDPKGLVEMFVIERAEKPPEN
jgi:uncharacterized protein (TIGR03435 family)